MRKVLITGGDGYLGQRIVRQYLDQGDYEVLIWVKAFDSESFAKKIKRLEALYGDDLDRISVYWGDLADPEAFRDISPDDIEHIIHTAAVIAFNVEKQLAERININGTRRVCEFAGSCKNLTSLGFISSLYASGLYAGHLYEERFMAEAGHANYYEWSKWQAEQLLFDEYPELPWKILRVGTIIADNMSGRVSQFNAIHNTLKLFYFGLLPIIPGQKDIPLYLATGDYVSRAIHDAMYLDDVHLVLHITHNFKNAVTLSEFIDLAYGKFETQKIFVNRRILKPLYSDYESFELLADGVNDFGGNVVNQAFKTVKPFAAQLFIKKKIDTAYAEHRLPKYELQDMREVITNTVEHLMRTGFKCEDKHESI